MSYKSWLAITAGITIPLHAQIVIPPEGEEKNLAALSKIPPYHADRFYEGFKLYSDIGLDKLSEQTQSISSPIYVDGYFTIRNYLTKIHNNQTKPRGKYLTDLIAWDSIPGSGGGEFNGIHFFFDNWPADVLQDALHLGSTIDAQWLVPNIKFAFRATVTIDGKDQTQDLGTGEIRMVNTNRWLVVKDSAGRMLSILLLGKPLNSPIVLPNVIFKRDGALADDAIYQSIARMLTSVRLIYGYQM